MTLVFGPDLTSDNQKDLQAKIKKIVSDLKGEVKKIDDWGKKEFTYPIRKAHFGYFFLWLLSLPEEAVSSLDKKLREEENIFRYLLIRKEAPLRSAMQNSVGGKRGNHGTKVTK